MAERGDNQGILTDMVRADLQGLVASHDKSNFLGFFMRKQANVSGATLLPFSGCAIEPEKLRSPVMCGWIKVD